jgi:hypothetical protein
MNKVADKCGAAIEPGGMTWTMRARGNTGCGDRNQIIVVFKRVEGRR